MDRLVHQSLRLVHHQPEEKYSTHDDVRVEDSSLNCEPPHFNGCPAAADDCQPKAASLDKKPSYLPINVDRRENRNKLRVKSLQDCIKEKDSEIRKLKRQLHKKDCAAQKLQEAVNATSLELETTERSHRHCQTKVQKLQKALDSALSDFDALEDSSHAEIECLK